MNKYFWASLLLIIISAIGVWWILTKNGIIKTAEQKRAENISAIYPTTTTANKLVPTVKKTVPTEKYTGEPMTKGGLVETKDVVTTQNIFSSVYNTERKLYIEKEYSGTRYVLWKADSKITLHVGNSWSWTHPGRELTTTDVVPNHKVFVYSIGSQKIVDFIDNNKKYTIQCVHNGSSAVKEECEKFISEFKLI